MNTFAGLPAEWWTAIGTIATALVALAAAVFAGWQVLVMRRTRDDETRPYVVVDAERSDVDSSIFNLVVHNIGRTVAHDVTLTFHPALQTTIERYPITDSVLVSEGIHTMPPGRRVLALLDFGPDLHKSALPTRYDVTVTLTDRRGRKWTERYVLDLQILLSVSKITEYGVHHIATALRNIDARHKKGTDAHGRLRVWVRDEDRRILNDRTEHALTGAWPSMATVTPPDWIMAVGRNAFVRAFVDLVPPLKRWLHRRL